MTTQDGEEPSNDGVQRRRGGLEKNFFKIGTSEPFNDQSPVLENEQVRQKKTYGRTPDGTSMFSSKQNAI